MRARDLSFWRQKAAEYSLSAAKQCSAVKYNSFWPYGHTPITSFVPCLRCCGAKRPWEQLFAKFIVGER